jgi:lipoprotein NlpD
MKRLCFILLSLCLLGYTANQSRAPVESREGESRIEAARPSGHTVAVGDTLYGIAWRYGMDYRTLAGANNIPAPYTIYPGQLLSLNSKPAATTPLVSEDSGLEPAATSPEPTTPLEPTATLKPGAAPVVTIPPSTIVTKPSSTPPINTRPVSTQAGLGPVAAWRWPTEGKVVRGYSGTVHKGIDIDGKAGDPVKAVAPGMIVYSGSGIVGYGKLLIVKHNELYLSAYGHNRRLLVKEGESVKAGQEIAEKGSSATNTVKLHFEIRREGKPIDPGKLLPER